MEKMTMQFIYTLKHNPHNLDALEDIAIKAMSKLTDTPEEYYYQPFLLNKIAQQMFQDYISTCDNPSYEIWKFFDCYNNSNPDMVKALLTTLQMTQVRDNSGYVNGFCEMKEEAKENA